MEEWCYSLDLINPARLTQLSSFSKDLFISKSEIINYHLFTFLAYNIFYADEQYYKLANSSFTYYVREVQLLTEF